jgi:hypothetical protein
MSIPNQKPNVIDNDWDIVILDPKDCEVDTTIRPLSEERRKEILKRLERQAELRKMMEEEEKENGKKPENAEPK